MVPMAIPMVLFILYSPRIPESPKSLYLERKDVEKAKQVLIQIRGCDDVKDELKQLEKEGELYSSITMMTIPQVLSSKRTLLPLFSAACLMTCLQWSGLNGVYFNLNTLFRTAGVPDDITPYLSVAMSVVQFACTLLGGFLSQRVNRKTMLYVGNSIVCIFITIYTVSTRYQDDVGWLSWLGMVGGAGHIVGLALGICSISFIMAPQFFTTDARPAGSTLAIAIQWFAYTTCVIATPYMFEYLEYASMLPFLAYVAVITVFIVYFVPETKDKSTVEIQQFYRKFYKNKQMDEEGHEKMGFDNQAWTAL